MLSVLLLSVTLVSHSPLFQWLDNCNHPEISCHVYQFMNRDTKEVERIHILVCDRREGFSGGGTYKAEKGKKLLAITIQDGSKCSLS